MSDVLVLGGGLSGASAALSLARAGRPVHLVERHAGPTAGICGEFLSVEAQQHLERLGIDLDRLGAARVDRLRVVAGGRAAETRLPFVARGLSRSVLDEALLARAEEAGVRVERGVRVVELIPGGARTDAGERWGAAVLLATGKVGVREDGAPPPPPKDAHVGFKMHWRLPRPALEGLIELTLFPGGYAGLQPVEDGILNLCLVIRRDRLAAWGGRWEDVLAGIGDLSPGLRALASGEPLFARPVTVANLPYGRLHRPVAGESVYRLGDQAAMTASLTGDGMAIALRSGWLAARAVEEGAGADIYHTRLRNMVGAQMRRGMALQRLSERPGLPVAALPLLRSCPALLRAMVRLTRLPDESMI